MLLTESIQACINGLDMKRTGAARKHSNEEFMKQLASLSNAVHTMNDALDTMNAMASKGMKVDSVLSKDDTEDILDTLDTCVTQTEDRSLTKETVKVFTGQVRNVSTGLKVQWQTESKALAAPVLDFLSCIQGVASSPGEIRDLIAGIQKFQGGTPSVSRVTLFANRVETARKKASSFNLAPDVQAFLTKVTQGRATLQDLTPDITSWLREQNLLAKLRITF